jgi:hypothetical protein
MILPSPLGLLVRIRGGHFHGQADFYGKNLKTGRLTQLFFYKELPQTLAAAASSNR